MKTKSTFLMVLAAVICITAVKTDGAVRKGPYLIYEGVNTEMTVLWQLDNSQTCTIEWGETLSYGSSDTTSEYGGDHQHAYTIPGLTPGVKYYYQVVGVGSGSFTAAPSNAASDVKFLVYGDTRSNPGDHDAVCAEMINTYTSDPAYQTITLHVGDWVNAGDNETDWTNQFFDPSYTNTTAFQADMPLNGCKGNHEQSGNLFYKYFPYPYVSAFYWSFDYGPVHIAVVDQYPWSSTQRDWLENDLSTSTKDWKMIVLHEPGWSAGGGHGNRTDVQTDIQPLCLAYGVDFVLGGHNHYYARCDVDGVQHITAGGGGAPLRAPEMSYPYLVTAESVLHFCEIDIQGGQLTFVARRESGSVIDTLAIVRSDMQVTPNSKATFSGTEGGPFTPGSYVYTVSNTGDGPIDWTVDYVETWLQCAPVSGTLGAGQQVDVTVSLTSIADTLGFGTYVDTLTFTDTTNNETILRDVECRVGGSGSGLKGDYYDNMDLTGFVLSRIDATVNFDWGSGSPDPSIGADTFSARWTGQVQPLFSETYTFKTTSDDGVRLWVNGQQTIDNWTDHGPTDNTGTIALSAGVKYDITLEYYENGGGAVMKLYWSSASQSEEIIPQMQLYPPASDDTDPPTPDPMTWATLPYATGSSSIAMVATTASDPSGVEYYFTCTAGGGNDSGWQDSSSYEDTGLMPDTTYTYTVIARDKSTNQNATAASTAESATTDPFIGADDTADADVPVQGEVSGNYVDTQSSDNSYEAITEVRQGSPTKGYSTLEHKWTVDVAGGGTSVTFNVEAWQTSSSDGDNFVFAYSTDDVSYTDMLTVSKTADDDSYQSCALPPSTSGTVYIRVVDTDSTKGNLVMDTLYVDHLYIHSGAGTPDTTPPTPDPMTWATVPYATGTTSIAMVATTASDPSGVEYYFTCTAGGGNDSGWQDSTSYEDTGLMPDTQYTYTVIARDKSVNQNSTVVSTAESATTDAGCVPTDMHIEAVVCGEASCGGPNRNGQATVVIYDDCGNPVVNALVDGAFSGDFNETIYDVPTDANGQAVLTTVTCIKRPAFTFTVTDVTHATLPHDTNDDLTTGCGS